ncbi:heparanase-like [Amphibalanus amphitrite]|uniref:heparanase-like n=1 Tax=Amphibalanus amphitrite TaxID=1232801 RepID=UPI001C919697|nr:heparanase-like [Amphibalanus amphitrite]
MRLLLIAAALLATVSSVSSRAGSAAKVTLGPKLVNTVEREFLSFALDDGLAKKNWSRLDLGSERLRTLAGALRPAVLRVGGTNADCLIFRHPVEEFRDVSRCSPFQKKKTTPFEFTESSWSALREFVSALRLPLLFDLNSLLRDASGQWIDTNAREVISTLQAELNVSLLWQLGNEPNSYRHKFNYTVDPETLGTDFVRLRSLLGPSGRLVGPDVTRPALSRPAGLEERPFHLPAQKFLRRFLETGRGAVDAVTFHQYYFNGRTATPADFTNTTHMDLLSRQIGAARRAAGPSAPLWITESASAWGGGAPGLSDRYLAGFLWMDKLGVAARHGVSLVVRQALYGGHYGLLSDDMTPNPDYWLSYIYKLVVGRHVLQTRVSGPDTVRMYCHCGHQFLPDDSVTCFTLNLSEMAQKVKLDENLRQGGIKYEMTPPEGNLTAKGIMCNGKLLELNGDRLPTVPTALFAPGPTLSLPPYGIGFYVFRRAAPAACLNDAKVGLRTGTRTGPVDWD